MSTGTVTVSEARACLPDIVERVQAGDEVTLTRHGVPVAVIVGLAAVRARRADTALHLAGQIGQMLGAAREQPFRLEGNVTSDWADELVRSIRADRDRT